jgi:hypothetical protein
MKKLLFVTVLVAACGNSEPPKAPEGAAPAADAAAPAADVVPAKDAGAMVPDKK